MRISPSILARFLLTSVAQRRRTRLTLEILGPIESLLFLEQERIADERQSADRLAVRPVPMNIRCLQGQIMTIDGKGREHARIWPGNAFIVREVGRIILPFATQLDARDLGRDVCGAFICAHEVRGAVRAGLAHCSSDGGCRGLERV